MVPTMVWGDMFGTSPASSSSSSLMKRMLSAITGRNDADPSSTTNTTRNKPSPLSSRIRVNGEYAEWVRGMAHEYNCGSVNKTLRDLITWYGRMGREEVQKMVNGYYGGVGRRSSTGSRNGTGVGVAGGVNVLEAGLTGEHVEWLAGCSKDFGVGDREMVLERLIEFAMEQLDDEELFESICGLPQSTAALYSDLNIYTELMDGTYAHR